MAENIVEDGTISLKPLLQLLDVYQRVILLAIGATGAIAVLVVLAAALIMPSERTSSLDFRLLFDGASDNEYPNGTKFSPAEIVETPVLSEVYQVNDLKRFGKYEDFKSTFAVLASSEARELLDLEYAARLADSKLTPIDRTRIEDEYRKKRESIKDPVFRLSMRRQERVQTLPKALAEKVLNDTLATWASQAEKEKGALRFDVAALSRNLINPAVLEQDFLLAADSLRTQSNRLLKMADDLSELPGAAAIRLPNDKASLAEVRAELEDIQRYQIHPLLNVIRSDGVARDPETVSRFVGSQVAQVGIARDATVKRIHSLEGALQGYVSKGLRADGGGAAGGGQTGRANVGQDTQGVIPQLSDSFLSRLVEMSSPTQASEVAYRQKLTDEIISQNQELSDLDKSLAFYQDLDRSMKASARGQQSPARIESVTKQLRATFDALGTSADKLLGLYDQMSKVSLNAASLYVVTQPFVVRTRYALSLQSAATFVLFAMLLAAVAAPFGCAIHQAKNRKNPRAAR